MCALPPPARLGRAAVQRQAAPTRRSHPPRHPPNGQLLHRHHGAAEAEQRIAQRHVALDRLQAHGERRGGGGWWLLAAAPGMGGGAWIAACRTDLAAGHTGRNGGLLQARRFTCLTRPAHSPLCRSSTATSRGSDAMLAISDTPGAVCSRGSPCAAGQPSAIAALLSGVCLRAGGDQRLESQRSGLQRGHAACAAGRAAARPAHRRADSTGTPSARLCQQLLYMACLTQRE